LSDWNSIGVRGFRVNVESSSTGIDYDALNKIMNKTAHRVKEFNWKCQLYVARETWDREYHHQPTNQPIKNHLADNTADINETIHDLPIAVIADHQGGMKGLSGLPANITSVTEQPGFKTLMSLAKSGKVFIKISAFYRSSTSATPGYDDLEPLVKVFAEEVPQQLIWGSDWPHTESANRTEENKYIPRKFRDIDNEAVLRNIRKWVKPEVWQSMMVDTPARIYS
jgi:predicted TIM-barrel fold metal-dependent hydrolase